MVSIDAGGQTVGACPGASSVPSAPKSGNGNARKKPTMSERAVHSRSLLRQRLRCDARLVERNKRPGIPTAHDVPKDAGK
jgi:hypothetical protein